MVNPYEELDRRILGEVYGSKETMDNLVVLCDEYNSRWPGSGDDKASYEYMVGKLEEYGLESPHMEEFTHPGWIRGSSTLRVMEPREREVPCIALPMGCEGKVEAELIFLGDGPVEIYEKKREEIEGKIVMVTSRTPRGMTRSLHRSEKYQRSVLAGAAGWIFMNHYPAYGPPTGGISPIIPAVGVSYEEGNYLARLLRRKGRVKVKIETRCKNLDVDTWNVVADLPGAGDDDETLVYGSHYDGHDISQGAVDPASGAVTVMEIARNLWKVRKHLKRRVRLICFGAEETGLFGSYNYVATHPGEMKDIRFMLNLDSGGSKGKKGVTFHDFPELEAYVEKWAAEMNAEMATDQGVSPYSDHWPFFLKGVPSGSGGDPEARRTRTGRGYGHTKYDTVDKVEMEYLRLAAANYTRFLFRVANADDWSPRRKTQKEIQAFIEEQGYDQTIKLAEKVKDHVRTWDEIHPDTRDWLDRKSEW